MANTPCWPVPEGLPITSGYGWRFHPIYEEWRFHSGTDWGGGGQHHPLYAVQDGVVVANTFNSSTGYYIRIKHTGDSYYSQYQHLKEPSPLQVGDPVVVRT